MDAIISDMSHIQEYLSIHCYGSLALNASSLSFWSSNRYWMCWTSTTNSWTDWKGIHSQLHSQSMHRHMCTIHLNQQLGFHPSACFMLFRSPSATTNGIYLINKYGSWRVKPSLKEETKQYQVLGFWYFLFKNNLRLGIHLVIACLPTLLKARCHWYKQFVD